MRNRKKDKGSEGKREDLKEWEQDRNRQKERNRNGKK